jgi:hypothetical protein
MFWYKNLKQSGLLPDPEKGQSGANPTIASYNASVVNFCNTTDSLARFENKIIFFYFEKHSSLGTTTLAL